MRKKLLSVVLAFAMVLTLLPTVAFADEPNPDLDSIKVLNPVDQNAADIPPYTGSVAGTPVACGEENVDVLVPINVSELKYHKGDASVGNNTAYWVGVRITGPQDATSCSVEAGDTFAGIDTVVTQKGSGPANELNYWFNVANHPVQYVKVEWKKEGDVSLGAAKTYKLDATNVTLKPEAPTSAAFVLDSNPDMTKLTVKAVGEKNVYDSTAVKVKTGTVYVYADAGESKGELIQSFSITDATQEETVTLPKDPGGEVWVTFTPTGGNWVESEAVKSTGYKSTDADVKAEDTTINDKAVTIGNQTGTWSSPIEITNTEEFAYTEDLSKAVIKLTVNEAEGTKVAFGTTAPQKAGGENYTEKAPAKGVSTSDAMDLSNPVYAKVTSASGVVKYYKIIAKRAAASDDTSLKSVTYTYTDGQVTDEPLTLTGADTLAAAIEKATEVTIAYNSKKSATVTIKAEATHAKALLGATAESVTGETLIDSGTSNKEEDISATVTWTSDAERSTIVGIKVESEDGGHTTYYAIKLVMENPLTESALTKITVDGATTQPTIPAVAEGKGTQESPYEMTVNVPYAMKGQQATVKIETSDKATAAQGSAAAEATNAVGNGSFPVSSVDEGTVVFIKVAAEDGQNEHTTYYKLTFKLDKPSDENGVEKIAVDGYEAEKAASPTGTNDGTLTNPYEYTVQVPADYKASGDRLKSTGVALGVTVKDAYETIEYMTSDPSTWHKAGDVSGDGVEKSATKVTIDSGSTIWLQVAPQNPEGTKVYYKITLETVDVEVAENASITTDAGKYSGTFTSSEDLSTSTVTSEEVKTFLEQKSVELATEHPEIYGSEAAKAAYDKGATEQADNVDVKIVETIKISVEDYNATIDSETMTVDITPTYVVIAVNQTDSATVDSDFGSLVEGTDYVVLSEAQPIPAEGKAVTVTVPVPFVKADDYIQIAHTHEGKTYTDVVKATDAKKVTFTNTHGFSDFTFTKATDALLNNLTVSAGTLTPAFDATVKEYTVNVANEVENIKLTATFAAGLTVTATDVSTLTSGNASSEISLTAGEAKEITITVSGGSLTQTEYKITVIRAEAGQQPGPGTQGGGSGSGGSGGGGGGGGAGSSTTVNSASAINGSFTVSDKNAKAGDAVEITPKANDGYVVDQVTVTDKNGKSVTVTQNASGTYSFVMPAKDAQPVTVKVTFKQDNGEKDCPSEKFADVDQSKWYHEGVDYAITNGLMDGVGNGLFAPNATTTRAMVVTILYRLEGSPAVTKDVPFADVAAGQWYSDAIVWAAANGIVNGYSETKFGPNDPITREQMAAILYRYAQYSGSDVSALADLSGYTDAGSVSSWAATATRWAVSEGLIEGTGAAALSPSGSATRAQVATILMRFCEGAAQ